MQDVLDDFVRTVEEAAARLLSLTEGEARVPLAEGKWSAKEVIGHLIDSASNNHQRFVRAQLKEDLVFEGYAQEEWVRAQADHTLPETGGAPASREEPATLEHLMRDYVGHLKHHLRQVFER